MLSRRPFLDPRIAKEHESLSISTVYHAILNYCYAMGCLPLLFLHAPSAAPITRLRLRSSSSRAKELTLTHREPRCVFSYRLMRGAGRYSRESQHHGTAELWENHHARESMSTNIYSATSAPVNCNTDRSTWLANLTTQS